MMNEDTKQNFFTEQEYIHINEINSLKKEIQTDKSLSEILTESAEGKYKLIWQAVNELKFGYYNNSKFIFADNVVPNEKYIMQIRLFNEDEEILLQKNGEKYNLRIIRDDIDKGIAEAKTMKIADNASTLFGKREKMENSLFAKLIDRGRKISLTIPTEDKAEYYALITRSYIEYDEKTGQAGYGYYRYLDIRPQVKQ